ncbi:protein PXR1-like [Vicia villosa]|uniref:protein PXR1-like n=1 Tax=Vicia villosa TaxID=3911 RepID=UPI00273BFFDC|nr:protein PXR1-like [Vicia villosa]
MPEVRTSYLNSLKEGKEEKEKVKGAPAKGGRKKASTSKPAASEDVSEAAPESVSVATKKNEKESAEKKNKKKRKMNKNVDTEKAVEKKKERKRKLIIDASDEDEEVQEAVNQKAEAVNQQEEITQGPTTQEVEDL